MIEFDLTRRDWGARPPNRAYVEIHDHDRPGLETHNSVGLYGANDPATFARGLQADHLGRNWTDAFYNVGIWTDGRTIELRPWHAKSGPVRHLTVCFAGNYDRLALTDAQKRAWWRVYAALTGGDQIAWHSQRAPVGCPGATVRRWLTAGAPPPPSEHTVDLIVIYAAGNDDELGEAVVRYLGPRAVSTSSAHVAAELRDGGAELVLIGGPARDTYTGPAPTATVVGRDRWSTLAEVAAHFGA